MTRELKLKNRFSMNFYITTVFAILGQPRKFFSVAPAPAGGMHQALFFLVISAVFSCAASLVGGVASQTLYLAAGIYLFNALGMVFILAALGYLVMVLSYGNKMPFARLLSIYALCSGVTLLVSWVPYFVVFTEPWKWYLIGTGLTKGCGLKIKEAVLIIVLSLTVWILFYWSLTPVISR